MIIGVISTEICIAIGGAALFTGTVLSYYLWQVVLRNRRKKIITEAEAEAEVIKKEKILQAKERFCSLRLK
jgi:ribonuclease Y